MAFTFQTPRPSATSCINTYTIFTPNNLLLLPSVSNRWNTLWVVIMPCMGFLNSIKTIMMLKICSVLPDMYIMIAFMGICLAGARAISQDFLSFSTSVSSVVGGVRWTTSLRC